MTHNNPQLLFVYTYVIQYLTPQSTKIRNGVTNSRTVP